MEKRLVFVACFLLIISVSCSILDLYGQSKPTLEADFIGTDRQVPIRSSSTPPAISVTNSINAEQGVTPTPMVAMYILDQINEGGELRFYHSYDQARMAVLDLENGHLEFVILPDGCTPIDSTDWLLCDSEGLFFNDSGVLYLLDLLSGERIEMSYEDPDWIVESPNGRYLLLGYQDGLEEGWSFISYDLNTYAGVTLAGNISRENWIEQPILSYDGQHLALVKWEGPNDTRVYEINVVESNLKQIGLESQSVTMDYIWSPVGLQLIYGVATVTADMPPSTDQVYLIDLDESEVRLVAEAPEGAHYSFHHKRIWSLDGTKIALAMANAICIVNLEIGNQECRKLVEDDQVILDLAWSPQGAYIAFTSAYQGDVGRSDLMIYSIEDGQVLTLLEGVSIEYYLEWR